MVKIGIFFYAKLGLAGLLLFVPVLPVFIAPIWEWIETGSPSTFVFVYVLCFGSLMLNRYLMVRAITKETLEKFRREQISNKNT